jgi:hypothetical protein
MKTVFLGSGKGGIQACPAKDKLILKLKITATVGLVDRVTLGTFIIFSRLGFFATAQRAS